MKHWPHIRNIGLPPKKHDIQALKRRKENLKYEAKRIKGIDFFLCV